MQIKFHKHPSRLKSFGWKNFQFERKLLIIGIQLKLYNRKKF